eukprot:7377674-Pyramimonas_sp.AAC.1
MNHPSFDDVQLDLCQLGAATRSSTRVACWRCSSMRRLARACHSTSFVCSHSGRPHLRFDGRAAKGIACRHKAARLPVRASELVADSIVEAIEELS